MERDYYYINDELPNEIKAMAAFIMCFHLKPEDVLTLK